MHHCYLRVLFCCFLLFLAKAAAAQEPKRISGHYTQVPFSNWVTTIEAATGYSFYYDEKALDSFTVTAVASNETLPELLQKVFKNSFFQFSIDAAQHVFITRQQ